MEASTPENAPWQEDVATPLEEASPRLDLEDGMYVIKDGKVVETFDHDEQATLYHHSFYGTNNEQPLPQGHPPTKTMTAQMKLAVALNEELPEAQIQNVQRALDGARQRAASLQAQREEAQRRRDDGTEALERLARERSADEIKQATSSEVEPHAEPLDAGGGGQ